MAERSIARVLESGVTSAPGASRDEREGGSAVVVPPSGERADGVAATAVDTLDRGGASVGDTIDPNGRTALSDRPGHARERAVDEAMRELAPGHMLGHFRVAELLGEGGMGAVYRAFDTSLHRDVAIKVVTCPSVSARSRFLREARAQAKLRHAHVVPIHFVGEQDGLTFIVMELVSGETLADRLRRGPLPVDEAISVIDAVADALAAGLDAGLVHRDVKPSNVLVDRGGRVLLADFGLARGLDTAGLPAPPDAPRPSLSSGTHGAHGTHGTHDPSVDTRLTHEGAIVGTPAYLAPEVVSGLAPDHRADMYALGVSLFEAVTGKLPFDGPTPHAVADQHARAPIPTPRAHVAHLPPQLERLVVRLLAKRPEDRFSSYPELRRALSAARTRRTPHATFFARAFGFAIDLVALFALFALFALVVPQVWLAPLLAIAPYALVERAFRGVTLGKRLLGTRTVDAWGEPLSGARTIARTAVKMWGPGLAPLLANVLPGALGGALSGLAVLGWLVGLGLAIGPRHRALHDLVTRSRVVTTGAREETGPSSVKV